MEPETPQCRALESLTSNSILYSSPSATTYDEPVPAKTLASIMPEIIEMVETGEVRDPQTLADTLKAIGLEKHSARLWSAFRALEGVQGEEKPDWAGIYNLKGKCAAAATVDALAHEAATSPANDTPQPTDALKQVGKSEAPTIESKAIDNCVALTPAPAPAAPLIPWDNMNPLFRSVFAANLEGVPLAQIAQMHQLTERNVNNILSSIKTRMEAMGEVHGLGRLEPAMSDGMLVPKPSTAVSPAVPFNSQFTNNTKGMIEIPPESFGLILRSPVPGDYGLTDSEVKTFDEKNGIFSIFNAEYSRIRHKKKQYEAFKSSLENYTRACYRGRTEFWLSLGHKRFEIEVARFFQGLGWGVQLTGASGDRGIDIRLHKNDRLAVVQCKAYNKEVGPAAVRDLHSAMITAGAYKGFLVGARGFTKGVFAEVVGKSIVPVHSGDLAKAELSSIAKNLDKYHGMSRLLWEE